MSIVLQSPENEYQIWEITILLKNECIDVEMGDSGQVFCAYDTRRREDVCSITCFEMLMKGYVVSECEYILFVIVQVIVLQIYLPKMIYFFN